MPLAQNYCLETENFRTFKLTCNDSEKSCENEIVMAIKSDVIKLAKKLIYQELKWYDDEKFPDQPIYAEEEFIILEKLYEELKSYVSENRQINYFCRDGLMITVFRKKKPYTSRVNYSGKTISFPDFPTFPNNPELQNLMNRFTDAWNDWVIKYNSDKETYIYRKKIEFLERMKSCCSDPTVLSKIVLSWRNF